MGKMKQISKLALGLNTYGKLIYDKGYILMEWDILALQKQTSKPVK